jgi:hypothetical protein
MRENQSCPHRRWFLIRAGLLVLPNGVYLPSMTPNPAGSRVAKSPQWLAFEIRIQADRAVSGRIEHAVGRIWACDAWRGE